MARFTGFALPIQIKVRVAGGCAISLEKFLPQLIKRLKESIILAAAALRSVISKVAIAVIAEYTFELC